MQHAKIPAIMPPSAYPHTKAHQHKGSYDYTMRDPDGTTYIVNPLPQMGSGEHTTAIRPRLTQDQENEIVRLYLAKESTLWICRKFNIASQTLMAVIDRNNAPRRRKRRTR